MPAYGPQLPRYCNPHHENRPFILFAMSLTPLFFDYPAELSQDRNPTRNQLVDHIE